MKETLLLIAAVGHAPSEPVWMVLFGAGLMTLATWLRRTSASRPDGSNP